eukprot:jgi/Psemu1/305558/fgenesh1_kg.205_\
MFQQQAKPCIIMNFYELKNDQFVHRFMLLWCRRAHTPAAILHTSNKGNTILTQTVVDDNKQSYISLH